MPRDKMSLFSLNELGERRWRGKNSACCLLCPAWTDQFCPCHLPCAGLWPSPPDQSQVLRVRYHPSGAALEDASSLGISGKASMVEVPRKRSGLGDGAASGEGRSRAPSPASSFPRGLLAGRFLTSLVSWEKYQWQGRALACPWGTCPPTSPGDPVRLEKCSQLPLSLLGHPSPPRQCLVQLL